MTQCYIPVFKEFGLKRKCTATLWSTCVSSLVT